VNLPINPPILPMLAKRVGELPNVGQWIFEPKWNGSRSVPYSVYPGLRGSNYRQLLFDSGSYGHGIITCVTASAEFSKLKPNLEQKSKDFV
jgi:hypothetical protein